MPESQLNSDVIANLRQRGMESVLEPASQIGEDALHLLGQDLATIDWDILDAQREALGRGPGQTDGTLSPPSLASESTIDCEATRAARAAGLEALGAGRVALCTVAGGQASRLGFDSPKGAFPLGSNTGASLFQIMAGQVSRLRQITAAELPWIIQTGPGNHSDTVRFFERRNWFGLGSQNLHFVCQGTLPALSPDGQFLLSSPERLFRNPDGHGGFYGALANSGTFDLLRRNGVDLLFYCQVDNPLVRMGDPCLLGHHLLQGAQMSVKVIAKTDPEEKVGLVAQVDGKTKCIEYSDLSPDLAAERDGDGGLRFRAGNIAVHSFNLDFAESCADKPLELHLAHKQVVALDGGLDAVLRAGVKFETFVFDALPRATKAVVQMCDRSEEFAPVKNQSGADSILTSRQALDIRSRKWLAGCNAAFNFSYPGLAEIEPGLCYDASDLADSPQATLECGCNGLLLRRR